MNKVIEYLETLQKIKKAWHSLTGLILAIILVLTVYYQLLEKIAISIFNYIYPSEHWSLFPLLLIISVVGLWFISRKLPRFSNSEIGILFCPLANEKMFELMTRLKNNLHRDTKSFNINVRIRDLPSNYIINDLQKANELLARSNACLIIWGNLEYGEKSKLLGFPKISFTYKQPRISKQLIPQLALELSIGLFGKQWCINENDDYWGPENISNNIIEASLNILGKTSLYFEDFDKAIQILHLLLSQHLIKRQNSKEPFIKDFIFSVEKALAYAYLRKANRIYEKDIFVNIQNKNLPENQLVECQKLIKEAMKLDPMNGDHFLLSGIINFLKENITGALDDVAKAVYYKDRNDGVPHLSGAFLYFYKEDLSRGLSRYKKAFNKEIHPRSIIEVLIFIEKIIKRDPDKIQFHLALGIINKERCDIAVAKDELEQFVNKATDKGKFAEFIPIANKLLEEINSEN